MTIARAPLFAALPISAIEDLTQRVTIRKVSVGAAVVGVAVVGAVVVGTAVVGAGVVGTPVVGAAVVGAGVVGAGVVGFGVHDPAEYVYPDRQLKHPVLLLKPGSRQAHAPLPVTPSLQSALVLQLHAVQLVP